MAHVPVHDTSGAARRRLGRIVQVEALPPQPARHDQSPWDFRRRPWVHGYYGARADLRFGKKSPELAVLIEACLAAGEDPETCEELGLPEPIVIPAPGAGPSPPPRWGVIWPPRGAERPELEGLDLMPGTSGGVITLAAQVEAGSVFAQNTSGQIPPKAFITGFSIADFVSAGVDFSLALSAGGIGLYNARHTSGAGTDASNGNMINTLCSIYTKSGGPAQMSMSTSAVGSWAQNVIASISWVIGVPRSGAPVRR